MNNTILSICKALADKQAVDIKIVDITKLSSVADYFVICSARSMPQVRAVYEHLEEEMEKLNLSAIRREGVQEGRWIAVDYGDIVVHIFHKETREVYSLDQLWGNGNNVTTYTE